MRRIIFVIIIFSLLFYSFLDWLPLVLAEEVKMQYTDPNHLHAPAKVNNVEYQYDANGNLISDGERIIEWNQDNLPVKITKGNTEVKFYYDASGQRIVKQVGEEKTIYVNQYYQISVIGNQLSGIKHYFAQGRRIAQQTISNHSTIQPFTQLYFYHHDHLGSTILTTDSTSQPVSNSLSYFPYGNSINNLTSNFQLPTSGTNYLYTGQELDPESDLYNYNARLYNPKTGVFISADTVGSGNRYAYAENNPMLFTDPTGHAVDAGGGGYECTVSHPCHRTASGVGSSGNKALNIARNIWKTVKTAYGSFLAEQLLYSMGEYEAYETLSNQYRDEKVAVITAELAALNLYYGVSTLASYLGSRGIEQEAVLDIGTGAGGKYLNQVGKKTFYVAVDFNPEALQELQVNYSHIKTVNMEAEQLVKLLPDESFDKIVSYFPDTLADDFISGKEWYEQLSRLLKPNGQIVLVVDNTMLAEPWAPKIAETASSYFSYGGMTYLTPEQLRGMGTETSEALAGVMEGRLLWTFFLGGPWCVEEVTLIKR